MICPKCFGKGEVNWSPDPVDADGWSIIFHVFCNECSGYGVIHCCDGIREQPSDENIPDTKMGKSVEIGTL